MIAQLGAATFGGASVLFYLTQAFTAAVLVLAANTAFNGFPVLASLLSRDGYLPRQFTRRGDRLVFSNGIVALGLLAAALMVAFDADTTRLIQLYIIGVFVSFTLSPAGHGPALDPGTRRRTTPTGPRGAGIGRSRIVNAIGAAVDGAGARRRPHHQVRARGVDRHDRDAAARVDDDRHPAALPHGGARR